MEQGSEFGNDGVGREEKPVDGSKVVREICERRGKKRATGLFQLGDCGVARDEMEWAGV